MDRYGYHIYILSSPQTTDLRRLVSRVTRRPLTQKNRLSLFLGQRHHRPKTTAFVAQNGTVELGPERWCAGAGGGVGWNTAGADWWARDMVNYVCDVALLPRDGWRTSDCVCVHGAMFCSLGS